MLLLERRKYLFKIGKRMDACDVSVVNREKVSSEKEFSVE
jgi:hypothetical protein